MPSTFSDNLNLELQATGEDVGTWGDNLNNNVFNILDSVLGDTLSLPLSSSDVTLTTTQSQNNFIDLTGAIIANVNVIFPEIGRTYYVRNGTTGAFTVTLKTSAVGGLSYVIPRGFSTFLVLNGTDVLSQTTPTTSNSGFLYGLTLSNNGVDPVAELNIAIGQAADNSASAIIMNLTAAYSKRVNTAWAVGSGNGGWLDGASMPNGTGHVFLMQRSDTGVVDIGISASATAPPLPTNYDRKRRIGSIIRETGALVLFTQTADIFSRALKLDRTSTAALASTLVTLSVPTGIPVNPILQSRLETTAPNSASSNSFGSASAGSANILTQNVQTGGGDTTDVDNSIINGVFTSNTSAQIYMSVVISSGTIASNILNTIGWIDDRGRSA